MKHSAALKVNVGELVAINNSSDGILWEIVSIRFPLFTIQEAGTNYKPSAVDYVCLHKPTKAQLNDYNKRKEKYYEHNI
jgi:hypothetical protein